MTTNKDFPIASVHLCWLVFALLAIEGNADEPISNIRNLRNNLLDKYDRFARPIKNASSSVPVKVQMWRMTLVELNEAEETMTLNGITVIIWKDEHLQWDPNQHGGIDRVTFDGDEIWHPDIFIFTAAPITDTVPYNKTRLIAMAAGMVIWAPPTNIRTRCPLSLLKPMEDRICNLSIVSYSYYKHELDLQLAWTDMTQDLLNNGNPIWEIKNVSSLQDTLQFDTLEYPIVTFSIRIRRRYDSISDVVRGPRTVAILLTLLMFWLPSTSDKKLNLGCLVLLVLSGSIIYLSSTVMSPSLLSVTVIPLRVILFTATSALLIEVIILNLSRLSDIIRPSPTLIRILSGMVGRVIGVCSRLEYKEDGGTVRLPESEEEEVLQPTITIEEEWSLLAMALDRMFFVIYSIIFTIIS